MQELNLPTYSFNIRGNKEIWDVVRKKYVALTPEEWVRQHLLLYLIEAKKVPASLIAVEKSMKLNGLIKRADVAVFENNGKAIMLIECKAPEVQISQKTFEQIAGYNMVYGVKYLLVSNGLEHYCAKVDFEEHEVRFLSEIPDYETMLAK